MNFRTAALVLAGGQSRRMGFDKALLSLPTGQRSTLLQLSCTVAQYSTHRTYVLAPWPERYRHLLASTTVLLEEVSPGSGPLVALHQGWSMILADTQKRSERPPSWLLVLACDMPALDAIAIQSWQRQLKTAPDDAIAALPRHNNRWEPLCGFYHRRCIPSLQRAVQGNIRSCQRWLDNETVMQLDVADYNMLRNCNTPGQWQQFLNSENARNL